MSERTVLEVEPGESITQFAKRLVQSRPAKGTFNGIELDIPGGAAPTLLADALAIIYSLKLRVWEWENR